MPTRPTRRHPTGTPDGGRFATTSLAEAPISLDLSSVSVSDLEASTPPGPSDRDSRDNRDGLCAACAGTGITGSQMCLDCDGAVTL